MSYSDHYNHGGFLNWSYDHEQIYSCYNGGSSANHAEIGTSSPYSQQADLRAIDIEAAAKGENKLGLKLTKTPSLLKIMDDMKISGGKKNQTVDDNITSADKLKAANFSALSIQIGNWKRESRHEGDLVAKCYFKKRKLVWEVLDGNLKTKIEFLWSNIIAIRQRDSTQGNKRILEIMLERSPLFFREVNPQPRKHTNWEQSDVDFTNDQASLVRKHVLEFAPGVLERHFDKIVQADPKLHRLSQQRWPDHISPTFHELSFSRREVDYPVYPSTTGLTSSIHLGGMNSSILNSSNFCQTTNYPVNQDVSPYQNLNDNDQYYPQGLPYQYNHQSEFATTSMDLGTMNQQHVTYAQQQDLSTYDPNFPYSYPNSGGFYQSNHDYQSHDYSNGGGNQW